MSGSSIVAVERASTPRSSSRSSSGPTSRRGVSARRTSAVVSSSAAGVGSSSTPYSAARSSSSYDARPGLDQVRREQRVVARRRRAAPSRRARRARPRHAPGRGPIDDARRPPRPPPGRASPRSRRRPRKSSSPSRHGTSTPVTFSGADGTRLVELVDAVEQVAELEAPEDLLQLRAVGRVEHELRRVAVDVEVAPHRRELLRERAPGRRAR